MYQIHLNENGSYPTIQFSDRSHFTQNASYPTIRAIKKMAPILR